MMKNYEESVKISHDPIWSYNPDYAYRILIIDDSGSDKIYALLKLIKHQWPNVYKIYWYIKGTFKSNYHLLINGRRKVGIKHEKKLKTVIDYSNKWWCLWRFRRL